MSSSRTREVRMKKNLKIDPSNAAVKSGSVVRQGSGARATDSKSFRVSQGSLPRSIAPGSVDPDVKSEPQRPQILLLTSFQIYIAKGSKAH